MIGLLAQQQAYPTSSFTYTSLGLSAVFLAGLIFVTRKYLELVSRLEAKVEEESQRTERLAVVLERVQVGMVSVLNLFQQQRSPIQHPTPEEMLDAFAKLERMQHRLDNDLRRINTREDE